MTPIANPTIEHQVTCHQRVAQIGMPSKVAAQDGVAINSRPRLVRIDSPSITRKAGIIGEAVDLDLEHMDAMRPSALLFHVTQRLLYTKWRDPGEEPKLHLFGQLKRITKQWLDGYLVCRGGTYPALLMYQELADMACERITAGLTRALVDERPIKALLDPYNPMGSTMHVNFTTSKRDRWETDARRCHLNWVILDSDWEAEFCRVAESHPRVRAYVPNQHLGLRVPEPPRPQLSRDRPRSCGHPPKPTTGAWKCRTATTPR